MKFFTSVIFITLSFCNLIAQNNRSYWYFVRFTDKKHNTYSLSSPSSFLSQRALDRRNKQQIAIDSTDLPVTQAYIDSLHAYGFVIKHTSRWQNAATILSTDSLKPLSLKEKSFIQEVKLVGYRLDKQNAMFIDSDNNAIKTSHKKNSETIDYGIARTQAEQCRGNILHEAGFKGENMQIAILDGGFYHADSLPAFDSIRQQNRILGHRDFVNFSDSFFETHTHGMCVFSILAANLPGQMVGSAPHASYYLIRTEDVSSEYPVEECNWQAGAELADSLGIDVISTSLGYSTFDDPHFNHTYAEMNGSASIITQAAEMAFKKGILVITSAGNERDNSWKYITVPADAVDVLTVGAVDDSGTITGFSSCGPTPDKRVKPDIVALGYKTAIQSPLGKISTGNGTSYSTPVAAGFATCLWQALPQLSSAEVVALIRSTASRSFSPDSLYGYGIPDFEKAYSYGKQIVTLRQESEKQVVALPTIFNNSLSLTFKQNKHGYYAFEIYDIKGRKLSDGQLDTSTTIQTIETPVSLNAGVYLLRLLNRNGKEVCLKLIHL
jgi:serine protease AprX